jgi:hypothetical protein
MRRFILRLLPERILWWLLRRRVKQATSAMEKMAQAGDEASTAIDSLAMELFWT